MNDGTARRPEVTVLVPALNEEDNLAALAERLAVALDRAGRSWELLVVLDGCTDNSLEVLLEAAGRYPGIGVIELSATVGQHAAIAAALPFARGDCVVTLDADLQNPPEMVPEVVAHLAKGFDAVGTLRGKRSDPLHRSGASLVFRTALAALRIRHVMGDPGCMLRGWTKAVVKQFLESGQTPFYLPVQLNRFAATYTEFEAGHNRRHAGESRYNAWRLARLFAAAMRARLAPHGRSPATPEVVAVHGIENWKLSKTTPEPGRRRGN